MKNKKNDKSCEQRIVKLLIWFIIALIALMLVLVVHDRYVFHKQVYKIAISEIKEQKKACVDSVALDSLQRSVYPSDTIMKSLRTNMSTSDARNHIEIIQTAAINNKSNPTKKKSDDVFSIIDKLKDTDGLISANGITYLISLVVALLIALVSDRVIAMEGLMRKINDLRDNTRRETKHYKDNIKSEIEQFKDRNTSFYKHTTIFNSLLNRIASVFNLSMMISNITLLLSKNNRNNKKNATEAGTLCSRLSLICDQIDVHVLDYLTTEEKKILITYLDDALNGLNGSFKRADLVNIKHLCNRIQDIISSLKDIIENIDSVEVRER